MAKLRSRDREGYLTHLSGRTILVAASALLAVACGAATSSRTPPKGGNSTVRIAPGETDSRLAPAPRWVRRYCLAAGKVVSKPVLCPTRLPLGFAATPNTDRLKPSASGYVFEGTTLNHWTFGAFSTKPGIRGYGRMRVLDRVRVRGRAAAWLQASSVAGIFARHLILVWHERGYEYALSAHGPDTAAIRNMLLQVARGMRLFSRARA